MLYGVWVGPRLLPGSPGLFNHKSAKYGRKNVGNAHGSDGRLAEFPGFIRILAPHFGAMQTFQLKSLIPQNGQVALSQTTYRQVEFDGVYGSLEGPCEVVFP